MTGPEDFGELDARKQADCRPDWFPRDIAARLGDAPQSANCEPQDRWDEIGNWTGTHMAVAPKASHLHLVTQEYSRPGSANFVPQTQQGSAMQLTRLIYTSKHLGLKPEVMDRILQKSRANNVRDLVTGALIVGQNDFMQLIEGSRFEIGKCFMRIMNDKHHHDIQIISCGDVAQRLFHEWDMHLIKISRIKDEILSTYKIDGIFDPSAMSEFAIEDLCRTLSRVNWDSEAA